MTRSSIHYVYYAVYTLFILCSVYAMYTMQGIHQTLSPCVNSNLTNNSCLVRMCIIIQLQQQDISTHYSLETSGNK